MKAEDAQGLGLANPVGRLELLQHEPDPSRSS
jgi:hypothetical protein